MDNVLNYGVSGRSAFDADFTTMQSGSLLVSTGGAVYIKETNKLYCNSVSGIAIISVVKGLPVAGINVGSNANRSGAAYVPSLNRIYFGDSTGKRIIVFDTLTETVTSTITLSSSIVALGIQDIVYAPPANLLYVSLLNSSTVVAVDPVTNTEVAEFAVGTQAAGSEHVYGSTLINNRAFYLG
jgi:hypothetical protein